MSAATQEVSPPSGFPLTPPQTIFYAPQSQRGTDSAVRESSDDTALKHPKRSMSPKSTASTTYITTPISTATTSPQTSCSSVPCRQQSGDATNTDGQPVNIELSEETIEDESDWKPYSGERYVRADIQSSDVEKALEGGDYVIIEEEILEEVFVQEPGETPNVVRRIRRKVLKCKSKDAVHLDDSIFSQSSRVDGFSVNATNIKKCTGSGLLDVTNIGSNKDSGIDCGANLSRLSEFGGERASCPDETQSIANTTVLSDDLCAGTTADSATTTVGTNTSARIRSPDQDIAEAITTSPTVKDANGASTGEALEDISEGGRVSTGEPSEADKPLRNRIHSADADDEYEGDSEATETKSEFTEKKSPKEDGDTTSAVWKVVQQKKSGVDPLLSSQTTPRHQPRRFQDPYQLDRHAVWYGDKYKWMTGVPLPAWVMELRISDESAFTECMEHFQAFGRWPSDAELGPCPAAIPAAGGGFMHNPAAPLPTFIKLTRDRHLLNQYFAHFRVFGRWPRVS